MFLCLQTADLVTTNVGTCITWNETQSNYICWLNVSTGIHETLTSSTICHISCECRVSSVMLCQIHLFSFALRCAHHTHIYTVKAEERERERCMAMSSYAESIQIESNRNTIEFSRINENVWNPINPPFCRLFSISFDLIGKLLSQNPSSFNTFETVAFFRFVSKEINLKKKTKTKKYI